MVQFQPFFALSVTTLSCSQQTWMRMRPCTIALIALCPGIGFALTQLRNQHIWNWCQQGRSASLIASMRLWTDRNGNFVDFAGCGSVLKFKHKLSTTTEIVRQSETGLRD